MSEWGGILLIGLGVAAAAALLWWLLVASEGVYLGRRVVIWLYDVFAPHYDRVKKIVPEYEQHFLARPIMEAIQPRRDPLVLDVATGTGRLPIALARFPKFKGQIIGLDLSQKMLREAARATYPFSEQITLIHAPAETLPFPDGSFDTVTCLEALEFTRDPDAILAEMVRVLRPGGLLLTTLRIHTPWMPGKTWPEAVMLDKLRKHGIEDGRVQIWQVDYRKVWGRKAGDSAWIGARPAERVVQCPQCERIDWTRTSGQWLCETCGARLPIGKDGVIGWIDGR
jgi:ubiquinone/menaquinone biosynthesis C-methylase UbiE